MPQEDPTLPKGAPPRRGDAGPAAASPELPTEPPGPVDTGSDAWWRAQADAQREAAQSEPPVARSLPRPATPPTGYVEAVGPATILSAPSPLDRDWLPADLRRSGATPDEPAAPGPAAPGPAAPGPATPQPTRALPVHDEPVHQRQDRAAPALPTPALAGLAAEPRTPLTRPELEPSKIGPRRAIAGALIALSGVTLVVVALLLVNKGDQSGSPTVALPTAPVATTGAPAPSTVPSVSSGPTIPPTTAPTIAPTTAPTVAPSAAPTTVTAPGQAPVVPVTVLNNSRIRGLADRAAARFRAGGWPVPKVGNYSRGRIPATTVYFAPGQQASAARFARQFGIGRVVPRFAGLPGSGTTVVLTRDYR